jgi:hypothetical protein
MPGGRTLHLLIVEKGGGHTLFNDQLVEGRFTLIPSRLACPAS